MENENLKFEFEPLRRNRKSQRRAPVLGMTLTVYDACYMITESVAEALDKPERISVAFIDLLNSLAIYADPDGDSIVGKKRNQTSNVAVRDVLKAAGCDFSKSYFRINNGIHLGRCVVFPLTNIVEVERGSNGKH